MARNRDGRGRTMERGEAGWRIVRSIVRLLYLVPSSFCGSSSHPRSPPAPSSYQPVFSVFLAPATQDSPSYVAHRPLTSTPIPVFTPLHVPLSLSFSHLPDLTLSPIPSFALRLSIFLPRMHARVFSPFLGLFPLSATTTTIDTTTTISIRSHRRRSLRRGPPGGKERKRGK